MGVAHVPLDLGPRGEGGHRVDDDHVERTRADQHVGDLQGPARRCRAVRSTARPRPRRWLWRRSDRGRARRRRTRRSPRSAGPRPRRAAPRWSCPRTPGRRSPPPGLGGAPPTPSAKSRASAPVGVVSMAMAPFSPIFITAPWPNCFSIWPRAISSALSRSTSPPSGQGFTAASLQGECRATL